MLWQYISDNYNIGEPIIAADIDLDISEVSCRQQFKRLTDEGKLRRYENGVYYIPQKSRLGGERTLLPDNVVEYRYISRNRRVFGYYSGGTFANQIGITTQMPSIKEIISSEIGNPIKRIEKGSRSFVVRKSRTEINEENYRVLQFLDLMKDIGMYSELQGEELTHCLAKYIKTYGITKAQVDRYLPIYPERIYKSFYETGITNVFTQ